MVSGSQPYCQKTEAWLNASPRKISAAPIPDDFAGKNQATFKILKGICISD
jgi:hypothetical protein